MTKLNFLLASDDKYSPTDVLLVDVPKNNEKYTQKSHQPENKIHRKIHSEKIFLCGGEKYTHIEIHSEKIPWLDPEIHSKNT